MDREKLTDVAKLRSSCEVYDLLKEWGEGYQLNLSEHELGLYSFFHQGADWLMQQPLKDRLTEEEAEKIRKLNSIIDSMFDMLNEGHVNQRRVIDCEDILIRMLGRDFFKTDVNQKINIDNERKRFLLQGRGVALLPKGILRHSLTRFS